MLYIDSSAILIYETESDMEDQSCVGGLWLVSQMQSPGASDKSSAMQSSPLAVDNVNICDGFTQEHHYAAPSTRTATRQRNTSHQAVPYEKLRSDFSVDDNGIASPVNLIFQLLFSLTSWKSTSFTLPFLLSLYSPRLAISGLISPVLTRLRLYISHIFRYHSPSYHSRDITPIFMLFDL